MISVKLHSISLTTQAGDIFIRESKKGTQVDLQTRDGQIQHICLENLKGMPPKRLAQGQWERFVISMFPKISFDSSGVASIHFIPKCLGGMESRAQRILKEELSYGKKLGQGSFGKVYEGKWLGAPVAIKKFINQTLTENAQEEMENEQSTMLRLRHPLIIAFYGICQDPLSLVMELMPKSLYQFLHSAEDLPWELRYRIGQDIASGLCCLHRNEIIHRDLKSLNILLDSNKRAKITDFGLAQIKVETGTTSSKKVDQEKGSLRWMAPELFSMRPNYSKKSDIFSYGVILWEIASRSIPFPDVVEHTIFTEGIRNGVREDCSPDWPVDFTRLITDCWNQDAQQRPCIEEIQNRFAQILGEAVVFSEQPLEKSFKKNEDRVTVSFSSGKEDAKLRSRNEELLQWLRPSPNVQRSKKGKR